MAEIYQIPDSNGGNSSIPAWVPFMNNNGNGLLGGNGLGGGIVGFLLVLAFGNNGNGLFGGGGNNANSANAQMLANAQQYLMEAIHNNGDRNTAAIQNLSSTLNQDFNLVNSGVQTINNGLAAIAATLGTTPLQIINSIQAGNADLRQQLCQCCCDNRYAIAEQTNALQQGIGGIQTQMALNAGKDELATCQQTYTLTDGANRNTQAILNKLSEMQTQTLQDKLEAERDKNTALKGEISQLNQNQYIAGVVGQNMAPLAAQLAALNKEVDDIKCKLPNTINVEYPQVSVVNTTPYMGGFYGNGFYGNGFGGNIVF